jgi:hypothetical protein
MQNFGTKTIPALAVGLALGAAATLSDPAAARDGGYYGSYDRDWRSEDMDGYGRDRLDRRDRMGRDDDRRYDRRSSERYGRDRDSRNEDRDEDRRSSGGSGSRQGALDRLLAEHAETQTALQQARPLLQEARTALQQNDRARAEQALTRLEAILNPAQDSRKQAERSLDDLEQAIRRNDREAADQALRRVREAVEQSAAAASQAGAGTQSGGTTGGATTSGGSGATSGSAARPQ